MRVSRPRVRWIVERVGQVDQLFGECGAAFVSLALRRGRVVGGRVRGGRE